MESKNDVESYRKSVQRLRVHIFLAGLEDELEQVHGEILRKKSRSKIRSTLCIRPSWVCLTHDDDRGLGKMDASAMVIRD